MSDENKKNQLNTDIKTNGRRKLLKSVLAGGGAATVANMLPEQWARPVVDSVMLPSHATTSQLSPLGPFVNSAGPFVMSEQETQMADQGFSEELLEFFAPAAHAMGVSLDSISLTVNDTGDSYLCGTYNLSTQVLAVTVQNNAFAGTGCLHGYPVTGGAFVENQGWQVSFNVGTTVTLTPGPTGCSPSNPPGSCVYSM